MATGLQKLRFEFQNFKSEVIEILEKINDYNHEKDVLGPERQKTEKIKELINSLKKGD